MEKFQYSLWGFIAIYAILLLNLLFTLFCREIFATIFSLSCGEKLSPKVHLCRKNDKYQVCANADVDVNVDSDFDVNIDDIDVDVSILPMRGRPPSPKL